MRDDHSNPPPGSWSGRWRRVAQGAVMRRGHPGRPRPTLIAVLLSAAVLLAGVLAYQAQAAARSHRLTAERALHDYATFAMWELSEHATREILGALIATFIGPVTRVDPADPAAWPSPDEFRSMTTPAGAPFEYLKGARFFFRFDWRDSSFVTAGQAPSPAVSRWVRDTVAAYGRIFAETPTIEPKLYGSADRSPLKRLSVVITNDSYVATFGHVDGRLRVVAYVVSRDYDGKPLVTYGFESDASAFIAPLLAEVMQTTPLLPPSVTRGIRQDSVLAVRATAPAGGEMFRSTGWFSDRYAVADRLDERFGGLELRVSLRPEVAPRLVVGGLPQSRMPMIVLLMTITAALIVVALRLMRRQQELARLRTDFVSGVSHELRTPLAQIRMFAELLRNGQLRSDDERRRSAEIIDEEAQRLTYLVENVLSFARAEHRRVGAARRSGGLTAKVATDRDVRRAVEAFAPLARARRATIQADLEPRTAAAVDPSALRQVLLNLLDNAVKYGPPGQTVTVGMQAVEPTPRQLAAGAEDAVRIWVDDQGPGIPDDERAHIWDPFRRLERTLETAVGGSGIGLSIVKDLLDQNGGRVWVEESPGGGARFVVELPAGDAQAAEALFNTRTPVGGVPV
ncbi:MAG: sensor histidine kinase [Gemmatimonadaceae bacterium]